ncbi:MAG: FAD:protein FMN transferase [Devosiaceae bacterium]
MISRRRILTIAAGCAASTLLPLRAQAENHAQELIQWRGVALGADASITLADHPRADAIIADALAEISRLEAVFSLHDTNSALVRLNRDSRLDAPPFELLECLSLAGAVHDATDGYFDPTIQPLWAMNAQRHGAGSLYDASVEEQARGRVGWSGLSFDASSIQLAAGMQLTLNGIAQGYIADQVAALLRSNGLTNILINTGEFYAQGGQPDGQPWPISLNDGQQVHHEIVSLENRALASSAPRGITFDQAGQISHIIDPKSGQPVQSPWTLISVLAPKAGLADALSTAFCLMDAEQINASLQHFTDVKIVYAG